MKIKYCIYILFFLVTYLLSITSVLYTETFILLLSVSLLFIWWLCEAGLRFEYQDEDVKWNETILFYIILKNWHRSIMRDTDIRMIHFLLLFIQLQKYEIELMKRNIKKINKRDNSIIQSITLRRLEILASYKNIIKAETSISGLRRLPLTVLYSSTVFNDENNNISEIRVFSSKKVVK
jgi:hypothetical protein